MKHETKKIRIKIEYSIGGKNTHESMKNKISDNQIHPKCK